MAAAASVNASAFSGHVAWHPPRSLRPSHGKREEPRVVGALDDDWARDVQLVRELPLASAMPQSWEPDAIVGERYRLLEHIGSGGMGHVWKAEHLALRAPVALKLMHYGLRGGKGLGEDEAGRVTTKLLREARAAAALSSPHVVRILDYGVHEDRVPYIAMELLEGETLADRLERLEGPLPLEETCRFMTHIARGVGKAHAQGLVHRDLKPENIFLVQPDDDDDEEIAKVLDFGIARLTSRLSEGVTAATKVGTLLGTPNYMSPEQADAESLVDYRSDLWSMALIAFECVTGHVAFEAPLLGELLVKIVAGPIPVPSAVHPGIPPAFDEWFLASAERDPEARPASARELAHGLRDALLGGATGSAARRLSSGPPATARPRGALSGIMSLGMGAARRKG